jgi:hypothetical protein
MQKIFLLLGIAFLATFTVANAQIKTPAPSPVAKLSQEVGLGKVDLEYSRPSSKGRKVFGDLVPFGEMWRTGANASTKVTFSEKTKVGGIDIDKGTYAFYTIPGEKSWTIIFYKNTTFWGVPGKDFAEADVAARFNVNPETNANKVETLTMEVANIKNNGADLELLWEYTKVVIPFTFDTDSKVMADIKAQMEGPSANTYYQAARYYLEEKKDLNIALAWIQQALDKGGEKFWIVRTKALILAELGRYKDAIAAAERSTELAKTEGNTDYPRMNDKSIAEWSKKK